MLAYYFTHFVYIVWYWVRNRKNTHNTTTFILLQAEKTKNETKQSTIGHHVSSKTTKVFVSINDKLLTARTRRPVGEVLSFKVYLAGILGLLSL